MGYYTRFKLETYTPEDYRIIAFALEKQSNYDSLFSDGEPYKWYELDEDCEAVSAEYPTILFAINGDGEESGDKWQRVYHNGNLIDESREPEWHYPQLPKKKEDTLFL